MFLCGLVTGFSMWRWNERFQTWDAIPGLKDQPQASRAPSQEFNSLFSCFARGEGNTDVKSFWKIPFVKGFYSYFHIWPYENYKGDRGDGCPVDAELTWSGSGRLSAMASQIQTGKTSGIWSMKYHEIMKSRMFVTNFTVGFHWFHGHNIQKASTQKRCQQTVANVTCPQSRQLSPFSDGSIGSIQEPLSECFQHKTHRITSLLRNLPALDSPRFKSSMGRSASNTYL